MLTVLNQILMHAFTHTNAHTSSLCCLFFYHW